ncbi:MAG: FapA family protein, partial [Phycisphaerales bacterium]
MQEHALPIRVDVSPDGLEATLSVPSGTPKGEVDAMNVQALMAERGIGISPERQSAVRAAIAAYSESAESYTCVIARGVTPSDGVDGSVAVLPEVLRPAATQEKLAARAGKDHHARLQIVTVRKGQRVGVLTRPTTGVDGVDVRGQSIAARAGRGSPTKLDASILVQPDGSLIAATDGVVELDADGLRVSGTLRLASVDFSSGNVEFSGDILVQGQVRDGFRVRASKTVQVRGLVDAATLESGSDVLLDKGMASAKGGRIECGRDLRVPCLNNITCNVARDAYVASELQDCEMVVGRRLVAMEAAIVRGETTVAGGAEVGSLGCEAHSEKLFHVAHA